METARARVRARARLLFRRLAIGGLGGAVAAVGLPLIAAPPAHAWSGGVAYFAYTGNEVTWTVPSGVTLIHVYARGAQGGFITGADCGGRGAAIEADVTVTPGSTLKIRVGQQPGGAAGGWPNGGNGSGGATYGDGGGGATMVSESPFSAANLLVAAGAGGGEGVHSQGGRHCSGVGGGPNGTQSQPAAPSSGFGQGGLGATQVSGGSGGAAAPATCPCGAGSAGSSLQGGAASGVWSGGGGGGYFGGGGGGHGNYGGGGGGGGSSYVHPTRSSQVVMVGGHHVGHGELYIMWGDNEAPVPSLVSPANGARFALNGSHAFTMSATDPEFDGWVGTMTITGPTSRVLATPQMASGASNTQTATPSLPSGTYTWSATARDVNKWGGTTSAPTPSRTFTVNTPPGVPTLNSPANGHVYNPGDPQTFSVTVTDANSDSYTATVKVTGPGCSPCNVTLPSTASGSTASGSPSTPFTAGEYSWQARAFDGYDLGEWSGTRTFTVAGPKGAVAVDPINQVRTVGEQATVTVTVTNPATGTPMPFAPFTVSRSGANAQDAESFVTGATGSYQYQYVGQKPGVDLVQVASGNGDTAQAAVEWMVNPTSIAYPSDACSRTTGNVMSGHFGTTYTAVLSDTDPFAPDTRRICVAADDGSSHVGGQVQVRAAAGSVNPDVGVDATETAANSCLPIGQRVDSGTFAGGNPYFLDIAPNPDGTNGAWVCIRVASVFLRLRATAAGPVTVTFLPDQQTPHAPYPEWPMTGLWSGTCKTGGGARVVNVRVGDQQAALYTRSAGIQHDVCVRAGPAGARLRVDGGNVPGYELGGSRDASCPWDLFDNGQVAAYTVDPLNPQMPAGVCLSVLGPTQRVTLSSPSGGLPIDVQQDPA